MLGQEFHAARGAMRRPYAAPARVPKRSARRRGSALILVLGVLVLLSIIGTAFVMLMKIELRASVNFAEDVEAQFLARQALAYCLQHPLWNPPATGIPSEGVDNDNVGDVDSAFFTHPLAGLSGDTPARFAILKKPFGGRLNVNWNSFYIRDGAVDGHQALNEGSSTSEVSLEKAVAAYLNWIFDTYGDPFGAGDKTRSLDIAKEIAARIVNYRYGGQLPALPSPPLPYNPPYTVFHGSPSAGVNASGVTNLPGQGTPGLGFDDDVFLDDTTLDFEPPIGAAPVPPNGRDADDFLSWVAALPLPSLNWRPDPAVDLVDENGDGEVDEANEQFDGPQEFLQFLPNPPLASPPWPANDDTPFGSADLQAIISNVGNPPLKIIVNDVLQTWVPAQGYSGYGGAVDYFDWLRPLFTTRERDYIGDKLSLNHLSLLAASSAPADLEAVAADRASFRAVMTAALADGGVDGAAADNTSWQILANLIDYLDADEYLTALARPNGWSSATDDTNANGVPDPGEPNTRTFFGTERQPYLNEFWIYNRRDDRFDNDNDGVVDDANPLADPLPLEREAAGANNAYFMELVNVYATPIILYNNPATATEPLVDWRVRVIQPDLSVRNTYPMSQARVWLGGAWQVASGNVAVTVPADVVNNRPGYLVIESTDAYTRADLPQPAADNVALQAAGLKLLPTPATVPLGSVLVNLASTDSMVFWPGDSVELVYWCDPDGTGPLPPSQAIVDRQHLPLSMNDFASPGVSSYDFAPSYERQDPRLARCPRADAVLGYADDNVLLRPTAGYALAEGGAPTTGGDRVRHTLGAVNDADDGDADPFDGNYDLGRDQTGGTRYDDLVEIPNAPTAKFGNVGGLGALLCVGPLPVNMAANGWSSTDSWLATASPYTAVPDTTVPGNPPAFKAYPLDAKKINFIDPAATASDDPEGRTSTIFDRFCVWSPARDGKDNEGDWTLAEDLDGNLGPTPGDDYVDERGELHVYGRVNVNEDTPSGYAAMAALPFVIYDNDPDNLPPYYVATPNFYIRVRENPPPDPQNIETIKNNLAGRRFRTRAQFYDTVVRNSILTQSFGRDGFDNHIYEIDPGTGIAKSRQAVATLWGTVQRTQRTKAATFGPVWPAPMFILPRDPAVIPAENGGDRLIDDKSEIDYTAGALMNMISLETELPQEFAALSGTGIFTYYITVQITDGRDVDDVDDDADGIGDPAGGGSEPDWNEGTVLAEKRIIALVNNALPATDPRRIQVFNWSVQGRYPER